MDDTARLEGLTQLLEHAIQRITTLEVQVLALLGRMHTLETQAEERAKLPFFQHKNRENT